jgi:succinate-semialdehyde dehydrogenase/glutarate-semialdehyde dehydrogenase
MKVRNPRTGEADYTIDPLGTAGVAAVATRLRADQPRWAALPPEARGAALDALADALDRHAAAITAALTVDTGRAKISRIEVDGAVRLFRRWAALAPVVIARTAGDARPSATPGITVSARLVPYPLVGVISPWNFPLTLALIDAVPALAAGCAVIVKPSEITPRFIAPLLAALAEADVPLAIIEGDGATGAALVDCVDYVAFTGSVATGRKVALAAASAFIPASLELGGKDPLIVLASADPVAAAGVALRASIVNTGQACQSIERVLVARRIAEPFLAALVTAANAARLNYPDIGDGDIGPFIFGPQAAIVAAQIADAVAKGAQILTGGTVETLGGGKYLRPTVLVDVAAHATILTEETFGPVIPVTIFDTIDEAVVIANDGPFGLSAAVLGGDDAEAVARRLDAGAVSINDASLTAMVWDAEKSSFGASGLGPSRMGEAGLTRFLRRVALLRQTGVPLPLAAYAEG